MTEKQKAWIFGGRGKAIRAHGEEYYIIFGFRRDGRVWFSGKNMPSTLYLCC